MAEAGGWGRERPEALVSVARVIECRDGFRKGAAVVEHGGSSRGNEEMITNLS